MASAYVHGYDPREQTRLQDQATTLVELLHRDTAYGAGSRVLEVGCGVGAQTVILAASSPGAAITSVDISETSVAAARTAVHAAGFENVTLRRADIFDLPFADASFDHVFVCFVLEHLARPVEALAALRRVLRPGGSLTVIEGDHGTTLFFPNSTFAQAAVDCQVTLQSRAKGDAYIGRALFPLLHEAGFDEIHVSPRMVYVDASKPELGEAFTKKTFTAMIAGIREPSIASGLIAAADFDRGIADLYRTAESDGTFSYTFFKARAIKSSPPSEASET